ncbi:GDSL-type esterase/lipase family protein [Oscillatoria sp. FACHB-1406]|uniref:GDSL-type esterase/lipase family protein n=1 Tax=Oscillatoria sp. FACHB-1406 TaxID=2692846 RepID=UPI001683289A|nr:GDSL-type esterase/lipase family protein [Oscillatoria sp. FACHB-1406]MBD2577906.1 lysophospholipase [Oscillatoria sp. FACHB-1406]
MSDPFVLAASLLTTAQAATPPIPVRLLGFDPELAVRTAEDEFELPTSRESPSVEPITPEFSIPFPEASNNTFAELSPVSGAQLYEQRRMALQAGTLYTRLSSDSFYERWANATQQPTHEQWQNLLAREATAIAKGQGSNPLNILVGDSLSQWFPSSLLPGGKFWLNQGISGENTRQVRQRLQALDATRPNTIYVMAGINDLRQGASDREILDNLRAIAHSLRSQHPGAEIVLQSILPTRKPELSNARIRYLNRQIVYIARVEGVSFLNVYDRFTDDRGQLRADLTTDGLHLNRRGYQVWQGAMQEAEDWIAANR